MINTAILLALLSSNAFASWICVTDETVGFHFERGILTRSQFQDQKYVIEKAGGLYSVTGMRDQYVSHCDTNDDAWACPNGNDGSVFSFHLGQLRYVRVYDGSIAPLLERGHCSRIVRHPSQRYVTVPPCASRIELANNDPITP